MKKKKRSRAGECGAVYTANVARKLEHHTKLIVVEEHRGGYYEPQV